MDTHSKEPAYRCEFEACNFSARSLCSIKLHYRKVHEVGKGVKEEARLGSASLREWDGAELKPYEGISQVPRRPLLV